VPNRSKIWGLASKFMSDVGLSPLCLPLVGGWGNISMSRRDLGPFFRWEVTCDSAIEPPAGTPLCHGPSQMRAGKQGFFSRSIVCIQRVKTVTRNVLEPNEIFLYHQVSISYLAFYTASHSERHIRKGWLRHPPKALLAFSDLKGERSIRIT